MRIILYKYKGVLETLEFLWFQTMHFCDSKGSLMIITSFIDANAYSYWKLPSGPAPLLKCWYFWDLSNCMYKTDKLSLCLFINSLVLIFNAYRFSPESHASFIRWALPGIQGVQSFQWSVMHVLWLASSSDSSGLLSLTTWSFGIRTHAGFNLMYWPCTHSTHRERPLHSIYSILH